MSKPKLIDWKLIGILALFYAVFDVMYMSKIIYMRSITEPTPHRLPLADLLLNNFLFDWVIIVVFMSLIAISTKIFIQKKIRWSRIIFIHLTFAIVMGVVVRLSFDISSILLGKTTFKKWDIQESVTAFMNVVDLNFLIYFAMSGIIYIYYYLGQVKKTNEQNLIIENQLNTAKIRLLNSKLQPHFLFNTLNTISCLVAINQKKAQNSLSDLSEFLRDILYTDEPKIKLRYELSILNKYLDILDARFGDHIKIVKSVQTKALKCLVPSMILQPLIENAVKHGFSPMHQDLVIIVEIKVNNERLEISVKNNGKTINDSNTNLNSGFGIRNIRERLMTLYNGDFTFKITDNVNEKGVMANIIIPAEIETQNN